MPKEAFAEFANPMHYPYLAVATTSTHDMAPLRAWWEESEIVREHFYNNMLDRKGKAPQECEADICRQIVEQHLASPAMLTILPWQDWLSISKSLRRANATDERINIPANAQHRWCYRIHMTLNELLKQTEFNDELASMIKRSGR